MKKAQKERALQHPLIDMSQRQRFSPVDMLLTQYFATDPRPFHEVRQRIVNELQGTPELKWLMLAMAYWSFVGVDNVLESKHRVGLGRHRLKVIEADTLGGSSNKILHGFYSNKHSVYLAKKAGDVIRTLIHEMTHGLTKILYENDCNPYSKLDEQEKSRWLNQIKKLIIHLKEHSDAIDEPWVFLGIGLYSEAEYASEMIARIFQYYIMYPNEDFSKLPSESREFILSVRAEFVRRTRQWCQNFASDVGLHLLPDNEQYLANIQGDLMLTEQGLALLQKARDNGDMSVLEYRLNQLALMEDEDDQYAHWLKIMTTTPEVSMFRAACKFEAISQLMDTMGERGSKIDLSILSKDERLKGLFLAARFGNAHRVERLLSLRNIDIKDVDENGRSVFYWLGFDHNLEMLKIYLDQLRSDKEQLILKAVKSQTAGHSQDKVVAYIEQLATEKKEAVLQAMTAALHYGQQQVVMMLLDRYPSEAKVALKALNAGFEVWCEVMKLSPAFLALDTMEEVKAFLDQGVLDFTVMLKLALVHEKGDLLALLLKSGHTLSDKQLVIEILDQAIKHSWPEVIKIVKDLEGVVETVRIIDAIGLNAIGPTINFETLSMLAEMIPNLSKLKSKGGENLLHRLVGGQQKDIALFLEKNCKDWTVAYLKKNKKGLTPLIKAIQAEDFGYASELVARGVQLQLSYLDKDGCSPLILALNKGAEALALQIIQQKPETLFQTGPFDSSVFQVAVARGLDQVVSYGLF